MYTRRHDRIVEIRVTIRRESVVEPDGTVRVSVPKSKPGPRVSVTTEPEQTMPSGEAAGDVVHMIDLIKNLPGHRLFKTAEEVDDYLRVGTRLMGSLSLSTGGSVYVDANVMFYSVERVQAYR